jgi:CHAT domain-containing protein
LGTDASEQQLDRLRQEGKLRRYRLILFSTHGEIDWQEPGRSALVLARDQLPDNFAAARQGKNVTTGYLRVASILEKWDLDCDLVVLSACQTALGREAGGEGLLGFAQAFLQKGARSVVLSRWKVDDTATALLVLRFFENLLGKREGQQRPLGRAAALGEAKAWLRELSRARATELAATLAGGVLRGTEKPRPARIKPAPEKLPPGDRPFSHPYYWAAFVLVGDPW